MGRDFKAAGKAGIARLRRRFNDREMTCLKGARRGFFQRQKRSAFYRPRSLKKACESTY
jgi:hypothetical protein